jgi:2-oxoisovalerate dehydrogenase E2 component (dihydrolipoyl transacylase)
MKTFNLPDLGEGLAEAEIVRWHVNPGDSVKVDDPMVSVETAKAIVEVPSPFSGVIKSTHGKPGDMVATGALLVEFEPDADADAGAGATDSGTVVGRMPTGDADFFADPRINGVSPASGDAAPQTERIRAVPAARAVAKRLGIDLTQVRGTGRGGLITIDDVVGASPANTPAAASGPASGAAPAHPPASAAPPTTAPRPRASPPGETEPLRGPRRAMAHSMAVSRDNVMGCTLFDDADLHDWQAEQDITIRLLRAIAEACAAEPGLNAWFDGAAQTRRLLTHVDVAIAVDTPEGLIVPVVRDIAGRPVAQLRRDVDRLKRDTRDRALGPEDLRDFTFMLSNFGMIAGRYATPVVVPPAVAILGSGRLSHDVVATAGGDIAAHLRMPLSLTFDHRCVTGGEAARFMAALIRDLQKGS